MIFNFDEPINRLNTDCVKYDGLSLYMNAEGTLPMWVADMDFKSPPCIVDALKKRLEHEIFGYTLKTDRFYHSIIHWLEKRHGWEVKKEWISLSPGVVAGFTIAIEQFTEPHDKIIVQPPVYFPFFQSVKDSNRQVVYNPLKLLNGRYTFDFEDLKSKISPDVKMLILSNPHNPGGMVWTKEELSELASICLNNRILVVSDEIHADIVYKPSKHIPFASLSNEVAEQTLTVMSHSKTFNVAGLTTSYVICQNQALLKKYNHGLHVPHLHMGNIFGTEALIAAYSEGEPWLEQLLVYLKKNIEYTDAFLKAEIPQIKLVPPESTYLLWLDCKELGLTPNALYQFFISECKVAINEGSMFGPGGEGYIRMNIGCPQSLLKQGLQQIKDAVHRKFEKR